MADFDADDKNRYGFCLKMVRSSTKFADWRKFSMLFIFKNFIN